MEQNQYRLHCANGGRMWFASYEDAKKAQKKHNGRISMLMPEGDAGNMNHWIEL